MPASVPPSMLRQMSQDRKVLEVKRLMRTSTLNDHIVIDSLGPRDADDTVAAKKFETIKLRASFEGFSEPASPIAVTARTARPTPDAASTPKLPQDIFVKLPNAELVEVQPRDAGWFAVLTINAKAKEAIEAFVNTARRRFRETHLNAGYISPFSDPLPHELRAGAHARVSFQISEYHGKMLHSTFLTSDGGILFGPGDELLDVHQKPPLGACSVVVHLMGYWYDKTRQGPLLYLTEISLLPKEERAHIDSPVFAVGKSGSPHGPKPPNRMAEIIDEDEQLMREPSPPAPHARGSRTAHLFANLPESIVSPKHRHRARRITKEDMMDVMYTTPCGPLDSTSTSGQSTSDAETPNSSPLANKRSLDSSTKVTQNNGAMGTTCSSVRRSLSCEPEGPTNELRDMTP